jgi:glutamate racemase
VRSGSYELEIQKLYPDAVVTAQACPMWVSLVENAEYDSPGADYFVNDSLSRLLARDARIDTLVLGCTHFPLLLDKIRRYVPDHVRILSQGSYVASSLADYLQRHPDMQARLSQGGTCTYYTTESADRFRESASIFLGTPVDATHISLS